MKHRGTRVSIAVAALLVATTAGLAAPITYYTQRGDLTAAITFEASNGVLHIHLENTSPVDLTDQSQVLSALFFQLRGNPYLSPICADACAGSSMLTASSSGEMSFAAVADTDLGGKWAYRKNIWGKDGVYEGISSAWLTIFNGHDLFPGHTFIPDPNVPVGGLDYGLVSPVDNAATATPAMAAGPLVQNAVDFQLALPAGYSEKDIGLVRVQYGTNLGCEQQVVATTSAVPEPAALGLLALGGVMILVSNRRSRSKGGETPPLR